ncbi:MAG: hypothetical protein ACI8UP_004040 [Porticoccaceae bacterium]|jgi:hypothetical protein
MRIAFTSSEIDIEYVVFPAPVEPHTSISLEILFSLLRLLKSVDQ